MYLDHLAEKTSKSAISSQVVVPLRHDYFHQPDSAVASNHLVDVPIAEQNVSRIVRPPNVARSLPFIEHLTCHLRWPGACECQRASTQSQAIFEIVVARRGLVPGSSGLPCRALRCEQHTASPFHPTRPRSSRTEAGRHRHQRVTPRSKVFGLLIVIVIGRAFGGVSLDSRAATASRVLELRKLIRNSLAVGKKSGSAGWLRECRACGNRSGPRQRRPPLAQ